MAAAAANGGSSGDNNHLSSLDPTSKPAKRHLSVLTSLRRVYKCGRQMTDRPRYGEMHKKQYRLHCKSDSNWRYTEIQTINVNNIINTSREILVQTQSSERIQQPLATPMRSFIVRRLPPHTTWVVLSTTKSLIVKSRPSFKMTERTVACSLHTQRRS